MVNLPAFLHRCHQSKLPLWPGEGWSQLSHSPVPTYLTGSLAPTPLKPAFPLGSYFVLFNFQSCTCVSSFSSMVILQDCCLCLSTQLRLSLYSPYSFSYALQLYLTYSSPYSYIYFLSLLSAPFLLLNCHLPWIWPSLKSIDSNISILPPLYFAHLHFFSFLS